jgi:acetolactate synthase I/II/III large subunit
MMRVVDAVAKWFEEIDVQHYFGYAGGAVWPFMDALVDHPEMKGIQAKHESHAVHQADIYWRGTGRIAPVIVTKGPGLLNCVGGMASAMHDMSAVMLFAGSSSTHILGKGSMQEIYYHGFEDAISVLRPVTKGAWLCVRPDTVIEVLNQAYKVATSGKPGPVFIQLPLDIQLADVEGEIESPKRRAVVSRPRPDKETMKRVVDLIGSAERPVLLPGGGAVHSRDGAEMVKRVAEELNVPVATTLVAKGLLDETHPRSLGAVGRSGTPPAAEATRNADVVIAVGARFSDNHTSNWRSGKIYNLDRTKIVHVDVDHNEVGRNMPVEIGIAGDASVFLEELLDAGIEPQWQTWADENTEAMREWRASIEPLLHADTQPVHPARICHEVGEALARHDGWIWMDIGDVVQYAEPYMTIRGPGRWHIAPGMAEMSWASSGVLGAIAANPGRPAIALTGDGAFNMSSQVLATAFEYGLPAVWVILDNCEFGIERKGANKNFGRSHPWYSFTRHDTGEPWNPDYAMLARANGGEGVRIGDPAQLRPALDEAIASKRPWVIDVVQDTSVETYFTPNVDRAYPNDWAASYTHHGSLTIPKR